MVSPQFVEEKTVTLSEAKEILAKIALKDGKLNYLSNKAKEFLEQLVILPEEKNQDLIKKLERLGLIRLKPEHINKIIDFMPQSIDDLKIVLQAYPLSLPKKDQEEIVAAVKAPA
ncbi:MAG TPA: hypothetical protein VJH68_03830 [Candidatus Nanoarchaeia archaeon]|nr:hypothetical protein [Candidatus Nanoarchaeia archaeon]